MYTVHASRMHKGTSVLIVARLHVIDPTLDLFKQVLKQKKACPLHTNIKKKVWMVKMQLLLDVLCLWIHAGVRYSWLCTTLYLLCREAGPQGEYAPFFFRLVTFVCSYLPHSLLCLPHTLPGEWLNQCTPVYKPKKLACKHTHKRMYTTNTHTVLLKSLQTAVLFRSKCAETCIYLHPRHVFNHKHPNIYRVP